MCDMCVDADMTLREAEAYHKKRPSYRPFNVATARELRERQEKENGDRTKVAESNNEVA